MKGQLHEVFENTINNIGNISHLERPILEQNIKDVVWIDKYMDETELFSIEIFINEVARQLNKHYKTTADIWILSALVYKGRIRGVNIKPLINAILKNKYWLQIVQFSCN